MNLYKFSVKGLVQGVYYRKSVANKMNRVGVRGYVKNLLDGSVEVVVECSDKNIETILEILKSGSERSSVKSIDKKSIGVDEVDEVRLSDTFEVRY